MTSLSKLSIAELQAEPWQGTPWRSIPSANILFAGSTAPVTWSIIADGPVLIASQLEKEVAAYIVALQDRQLEAASGKDAVGSKMERTEAPDPEGWIAWAGGECPVGPTQQVTVRYRNGKICPPTETMQANNWSWDHCFGGADILAYRLTPAAKAP